MAVKKNSKKNAPSGKIWKILISVVFVVLVVVLLVQKTVYSMQHSPIFRIKEVKISPSLSYINAPYLMRLKGQSIFNANLLSIQRKLRTQYPEIDQLSVVRKFPDTIYVAARKREPVALLVYNGQNVIVDREGVVLSFQRVGQSPFPLITGGRLVKSPALGAKIRFKGFEEAVNIIEAYQGNAKLATHVISRVDITNLSSINLDLSHKFLVIVDDEEPALKLEKLEVLLSQTNIDFNTIKYIDLRFQEPILGKKEEALKNNARGSTAQL